jgi:hypothetical protein
MLFIMQTEPQPARVAPAMMAPEQLTRPASAPSGGKRCSLQAESA